MPEYLSKEEIKQWRSSLEKITLEEYAARLGKVLEADKQTNDLVDIVFKGQNTVTKQEDLTSSKVEKINAIAQKAFEREQSLKSKDINSKTQKTSNTDKSLTNKNLSIKETVEITFSKNLTDRETLVFNHFMENKGKIVYAKDLAQILDLPRDYVYKYIKNLRTKIKGDRLENAENGGYILNV